MVDRESDISTMILIWVDSTIFFSQTKSSQYVLNLGNRIYVDDPAEPQQQFAAVALNSYKTELTKINFSNAPEAAKEINAWVANKTEGNILNLVTEGSSLI